MGAVSHGKIGFVVAGNRLLTTQNHAWLHGIFTQVLRKHLVDANSALEFGPFLECSTGENVTGLTGMNSYSVGVFIEQASHNIEVRAQGRKRL